MKFEMRKNGYFMKRLMKGYTYGDALVHGIRTNCLVNTMIFDIQYRNIMYNNILMNIFKHKRGIKSNAVPQGDTRTIPQPCAGQNDKRRNLEAAQV